MATEISMPLKLPALFIFRVIKRFLNHGVYDKIWIPLGSRDAICDRISTGSNRR